MRSPFGAGAEAAFGASALAGSAVAAGLASAFGAGFAGSPSPFNRAIGVFTFTPSVPSATRISSIQKIEVIDIKNKIKTIYDSTSAAALALKIKQSRISTYFKRNQKSPYQDQYVFKKL
jgi:hypothetical protein